MKFSLFSFVLGAAGGAAAASWWINKQATAGTGMSGTPIERRLERMRARKGIVTVRDHAGQVVFQR